jgi:hypothetical protein
MEVEIASSPSDRDVDTDIDKASYISRANRGTPELQVIVKAAQDELRRLLRKRSEIVRRIGTVRQTISGLCNLIGDDELSEDSRAMRRNISRRTEQELRS